MNGEKSGASTIFKALLADINEGRLKPGDSLESEQSLMERFGVSRTMVRDAVSMLAGIGAIDRARGRAGVIQQVDVGTISHFFPLILRLNGLDSIREVYELRIMLESEAAALASRRATDEQLREIVDWASQYASAAVTRDTQLEKAQEPGETEYISTDVQLHMAIAKASGNTMMVTLLEILTGFLKFVQFETCRDNPQRSHDASLEHRRIAEAIAARDPDAARVQMSHHLRVSRDALEHTLDEQNSTEH